MSTFTLAGIYKKNNVRYIKPQYVYCRKMQKKDEIAEQQHTTVMEIAELMNAGKQVIYIDESQFHKQLLCQRVWVRKDMTLRKPDGRGKGVTVLGAISAKQGLGQYESVGEERHDTSQA